VFEVDHPATQAAKRAGVERLGLVNGNVTYVPVDFERDDLAERLRSAGFDRAVSTIFVWEGVTNYLTGEAVDATLAVMRALAAAGAVLVVTYVDTRALDDPSPFPEARRWVRSVARAGEPWTFGLVPETVERFFTERGFRLDRDLSTLDASRTWFEPQGRRERGSALYRISVCKLDAVGAPREGV
jgi:methyltransferase (TIGR00027 family)